MPAGSTLARPCIGFAHRGASADARENTLEAFRLALELGATGLESDVWLTADGVPVLDHDGLTPGGVAIPSVERRALPAHIPTLAELYERCGSDFELSLDVMHPEAGPAAVAVARAHGDPARLWLCHWNWRVVASFRPLDPAVRLVDSTRLRVMKTAPDERAARMVELGIDALNLHWTDWSESLADAFRARGRALLGWDAQDDTALARLLAIGVDGLFSDHVPRMMRAIRDSNARGTTESTFSTREQGR